MVNSVTYTSVPGIPLVEPGDDLAGLIIAASKNAGLELQTGDVVVVAQKVVSKAEGRYANLDEVEPSEQANALANEIGKDPRYVELVLRESETVVRSWPSVLIVAHRLGYVMANAGIDQSNIRNKDGRERVLLLPTDPDGSADLLKARFDAAYGVSVGVIINDSFGRPWRNGVVGVALGAAGLPALINLVGHPDMFGRPLRVTEVAVADEIAAGASLMMGQASEGLPVVIVRGLLFSAKPLPAAALIRPRERDMFR